MVKLTLGLSITLSQFDIRAHRTSRSSAFADVSVVVDIALAKDKVQEEEEDE